MYIFGIKFKQDKKIFYLLNFVLGLNKNNLKTIFKKIGFSKNIKFYDLTHKQILYLIQIINFLKILTTNNLKKLKLLTSKKLNRINTIKNCRFLKKLPINNTINIK